MKKLIILLLLATFTYAFPTILSDQGTNVEYNGATVSSGDLTILIWSDSTSTNTSYLVYNHTFTDAISNGSWNIIMNETDLDLDFGMKYYKDYRIEGVNVDFNGIERLPFYSPVGVYDINSYSIALGKDALATQNYSIALGQYAEATGFMSTAFGSGSQANDSYAVAVGPTAAAQNQNAFAAGTTAVAAGIDSISIGHWALAEMYGIALGREAVAGPQSTAIGWSANASDIDGIAIGRYTYANSSAVAIGFAAKANNPYTVAIGDNSMVYGMQGVAIGYFSRVLVPEGASQSNSIAIGTDPVTNGMYNIALGTQTTTTGDYSTAIGYQANASDDYSTAIGYQANASGYSSTAIGRDAKANNDNSIAIGRDAKALGTETTAMGISSTAGGWSDTAFGYTANASGNMSTAIGPGADALGYYSTALGGGSYATDNSASALGSLAMALAPGSLAFNGGRASGMYSIAAIVSSADGPYSIAIGYESNASFFNSIALGYNATTSDANQFMIGEPNYPINTVITGSLNITQVLHLTPASASPGNSSEGDIYFDSDLHKPCYYNTTDWVTFDGGTIC